MSSSSETPPASTDVSQPDGLFVEAVGPTDESLAGSTSTRRLVLAHGFTQNGRCWGHFGDRLAVGNETRRVDAPGHGLSHHDDADLWRSADLLVEAGGAGIYVGYSMGGRTAMHAALTHPDTVEGLVLIGATAGLEEAPDRADRRTADSALAERLLNDGLPAFLDRWLALPLFAGLSPQQSAKQERLTNRPEGLAASLRHCGTGTQEPLWERLGEITVPVLIVVGAQDNKFTEIGHRLVTAFTGTEATLVSIPGTHAVHLEQPDETADAVLDAIAAW